MNVSVVVALVTVLAGQLDPVPRKDDVGPGVVYGLLIFGLVAVTVLLWLSMRKQLRKVRFEERDPAQTDPARTEPPTSGR